MTDKLYCYFRDHFELSGDTLDLLESVWNHLEKDNVSFETYENDTSYYVPCFWHDFICICNDANIEIEESELFQHADGSVRRDHYYSA